MNEFERGGGVLNTVRRIGNRAPSRNSQNRANALSAGKEAVTHGFVDRSRIGRFRGYPFFKSFINHTHLFGKVSRQLKLRLRHFAGFSGL